MEPVTRRRVTVALLLTALALTGIALALYFHLDQVN